MSIYKEWENLKKNLPAEEEITSSNTEFMINVIFRVSVRCPMDKLAEDDKKRALLKRMSKKPSRGSY